MPRYLAIDADTHGLSVASGNVRSGAVQLEQILIGGAERPVLLSPSTAQTLGIQLAALLKQANIAPAPVLLAVGRDRIVLKEIKHPPSAPQDEPAVVRFQAIKELTDSPDDGVLDYLPINGPGDTTGERRALVAFIHKDHYAAAEMLCKAAGLKLAGVTPRPFANISAAARAVSAGAIPYPDAVDAAVGVLTLSESSGEFTVAKNGVLRFSRPVSAMALSSEATLVAEIRRNLAIYSSQASGDAVQVIYLAEGEVGASGWSGRLGASLPVPVYPFDPLVGSPLAQTIAPNQRGRYTSAIGLLAGKANIGPKPINFVEPRQPKAVANPNRNRIAAAMLLGLLLLAGAGFFGYILLKKEADKVARLRESIRELDVQLKEREPDLQRVAAAEEFDKRSIPWIDEVYDLSVMFPDISKMKVMSYVADALAPPIDKKVAVQSKLPGAAGPSTPAVAAAKPQVATLTPVAKVRMTVAAENSTLPEELVRTMAREKNYSSVGMSVGALLPGTSSRNPYQQFTINSQISQRAPTDYKERLKVSLPKLEPKKIVPDPLPDDGGAVPFDDGGNP